MPELGTLRNTVKDRGGMLSPGNIDLTKRPVVKNKDGSISTVRSISVNFDGQEILIPTVSDDGRVLSDKEAIDVFKKSGRHLGIFKDSKSASKYAKELHDQQEKMYVKPSVKDSVNTKRVPGGGAKLYDSMIDFVRG